MMGDKMLSVRIVTADTYMGEPIAELDITYSEFRGCDVKRVPVVRVFGATPAGQKTCLHVHGLLPYIYVPYDGPRPVDNQYLLQFAISIDKALQVATNQPINRTLHVFKITLVSGIPFYGYSEEEKLFMKIYFCNPMMVKKAVDLLHGGAIMNKVHQPHEAHIPFLLQFFIDYNLSGMDLINMSAFKFRGPCTDGKQTNYAIHTNDASSNSYCSYHGDDDPSTAYYDANEAPRSELVGVARQSTCELEVDCVAVDILNRLQIQKNVGRNPGLMAIWEDEKKRREELNQMSQLLPPSSPERGLIMPTESERQQLARLDDIIQQQCALLHSQTDNEDDDTSCDSSQDKLLLHSQSDVSSLKSPSQSQDCGTRQEVEPCIDEQAVLSVVETSQSFNMSQHMGPTQDKQLVALLADLADDNSPEDDSILSGLSQRETNDKEDADKQEIDEEEEEILMMSQAWDDDTVEMTPRNSNRPSSTDDMDIHLSWLNDSFGELNDEKVGEKLPQVDGGSDEKDDSVITLSMQYIPKRTKTLGARRRNIPLQFKNPMKVGDLDATICKKNADISRKDMHIENRNYQLDKVDEKEVGSTETIRMDVEDRNCQVDKVNAKDPRPTEKMDMQVENRFYQVDKVNAKDVRPTETISMDVEDRNCQVDKVNAKEIRPTEKMDVQVENRFYQVDKVNAKDVRPTETISMDVEDRNCQVVKSNTKEIRPTEKMDVQVENRFYQVDKVNAKDVRPTETISKDVEDRNYQLNKSNTKEIRPTEKITMEDRNNQVDKVNTREVKPTEMIGMDVEDRNYQPDKVYTKDVIPTETMDVVETYEVDKETTSIEDATRINTREDKHAGLKYDAKHIEKVEMIETNMEVIDAIAASDVSDLEQHIQLKDSGYLEDSEDVGEPGIEKHKSHSNNDALIPINNTIPVKHSKYASKVDSNLQNDSDIAKTNVSDCKKSLSIPKTNQLLTIDTVELNQLKTPVVMNQVFNSTSKRTQSMTEKYVQTIPNIIMKTCIVGKEQCEGPLNKNGTESSLYGNNFTEHSELDISDEDFTKEKFVFTRKRKTPISEKQSSRANRKNTRYACKDKCMELRTNDCLHEDSQNDDKDDDDDFKLKKKTQRTTVGNSLPNENPFSGCRTLKVVVNKVSADKKTVKLTKQFLSEIETQLNQMKIIRFGGGMQKENKKERANVTAKTNINNLEKSPKRRLACKKILKKKVKPALVFFDNVRPVKNVTESCGNDTVKNSSTEVKHLKFDFSKRNDVSMPDDHLVTRGAPEDSQEADLNEPENSSPKTPRVGIKLFKRDGNLIVQDINSPSLNYPGSTTDKSQLKIKRKPSRLSRKFTGGNSEVEILSEQMFDTLNTDCDSMYEDVLMSLAYYSPVHPTQCSSPPRCWSPTFTFEIQDVNTATRTPSKSIIYKSTHDKILEECITKDNQPSMDAVVADQEIVKLIHSLDNAHQIKTPPMSINTLKESKQVGSVHSPKDSQQINSASPLNDNQNYNSTLKENKPECLVHTPEDNQQICSTSPPNANQQDRSVNTLKENKRENPVYTPKGNQPVLPNVNQNNTSVNTPNDIQDNNQKGHYQASFPIMQNNKQETCSSGVLNNKSDNYSSIDNQCVPVCTPKDNQQIDSVDIPKNYQQAVCLSTPPNITKRFNSDVIPINNQQVSCVQLPQNQPSWNPSTFSSSSQNVATELCTVVPTNSCMQSSFPVHQSHQHSNVRPATFSIVQSPIGSPNQMYQPLQHLPSVMQCHQSPPVSASYNTSSIIQNQSKQQRGPIEMNNVNKSNIEVAKPTTSGTQINWRPPEMLSQHQFPVTGNVSMSERNTHLLAHNSKFGKIWTPNSSPNSNIPATDSQILPNSGTNKTQCQTVPFTQVYTTLKSNTKESIKDKPKKVRRNKRKRLIDTNDHLEMPEMKQRNTEESITNLPKNNHDLISDLKMDTVSTGKSKMPIVQNILSSCSINDNKVNTTETKSFLDLFREAIKAQNDDPDNTFSEIEVSHGIEKQEVVMPKTTTIEQKISDAVLQNALEASLMTTTDEVVENTNEAVLQINSGAVLQMTVDDVAQKIDLQNTENTVMQNCSEADATLAEFAEKELNPTVNAKMSNQSLMEESSCEPSQLSQESTTSNDDMTADQNCKDSVRTSFTSNTSDYIEPSQNVKTGNVLENSQNLSDSMYSTDSGSNEETSCHLLDSQGFLIEDCGSVKTDKEITPTVIPWQGSQDSLSYDPYDGSMQRSQLSSTIPSDNQEDLMRCESTNKSNNHIPEPMSANRNSPVNEYYQPDISNIDDIGSEVEITDLSYSNEVEVCSSGEMTNVVDCIDQEEEEVKENNSTQLQSQMPCFTQKHLKDAEESSEMINCIEDVLMDDVKCDTDGERDLKPEPTGLKTTDSRHLVIRRNEEGVGADKNLQTGTEDKLNDTEHAKQVNGEDESLSLSIPDKNNQSSPIHSVPNTPDLCGLSSPNSFSEVAVPDTPESTKTSESTEGAEIFKSLTQPPEVECTDGIKVRNHSGADVVNSDVTLSQRRKRPFACLDSSSEDVSMMSVMSLPNTSGLKIDGSNESDSYKPEGEPDEHGGTSEREDSESNECHKKSSQDKSSDNQPSDEHPSSSTTGLSAGLKVWRPQQVPPSRRAVIESLIKYGLKEFYHQEAYCRTPADLPDKSSNQPSHHNRIKSLIPSEFPKFQSPLSANGIQHWRKSLVHSFFDVTSASHDLNSSFQLVDEIENRPELRALTLGNKTTVITPCKVPPSRSEVMKWMKEKELYKQNKRMKLEEVKTKTEVPVRDKNIPKNVNDKLNKVEAIDKRIFEKRCDEVGELSLPLTYQPEPSLLSTSLSEKSKLAPPQDQPQHSTPIHRASTQHRGASRQHREASTPHRGASTSLHITQCTPILNVKEASTRTDMEDLERPNLKMQNFESFATPVARTASDLSEIDGPTPKNTYGFKVTQHYLKDAKAVHEVQHITVMSLEVHCRCRLNYRPDPEADAIFAIFYCIQSDTSSRDTSGNTTGVITLDTSAVNDGSDTDCEKRSFLSRAGVGRLEEKVVVSEQAMFEEIIKVVKRFDPDIFVGYEIQMLSWGYLVQRAEFLAVDLCSQLSRIPDAKQNRFSAQKDEWGADHMSELSIVGRIVLNLWRLMRHEVALTNYRFENVAFHVLHQRVPEYSFRCLSDWFDHRTDLYRWRTIEHYVIRVVGSMKLLNQLDLIGRTSELARVFGIQFFSVLSRGSQYRVESMMLRLAKPMNYIAVTPSVQQRARMNAPTCIPLVMEPESRFYEDPVIVLDFQSLYPSMMMAYNYCYSTCLGRVEGIAENGEFKFGCTSYSIAHKKLKKLFDKNNIHVSPNGVAFVKSHVRRGVLPRMVEEILGARVMVKKAMKDHKENKVLLRLLDSRQLGLKLIANVTYGYTAASFSGRMPCNEIGDSIVRKARETLERAIHLVESSDRWDAQVVYGDTDSLFILVKGASKEQAFKMGKEMVDAVTADNPKPVKLKFEKVYQPCVLQSKKRYVGYSYETLDQKEPIFDAKGIETVRRDSCPAVGKILERSIKVLFNTHDVSEVKGYVKRQCNKVLEGRISMQDLIFAKEYRGKSSYRPGACVPALELAKRMLSNDRRSEPRTGERVPYVIVYGSPGLPLIQLVCSPLDLINNPSQRLNAIYYVTKQILPPLDRIMSLFGVDVFQWYNELPKVVKLAPPVAQASENKQGTISQYFNTMNCEMCDQLTKTGICANCRKNPQNVATTLSYRMHDIERNYTVLKTICSSCQGFSGEKQVCSSLDCPVMFKLSKATLELSRLDALQKVLTISTPQVNNQN